MNYMNYFLSQLLNVNALGLVMILVVTVIYSLTRSKENVDNKNQKKTINTIVS